MAPVPEPTASSLISSILSLRRHIARSIVPTYDSLSSRSTDSNAHIIVARDSGYVPGSGVLAPDALPNNAIFAIFGLIGAGFVITGIWFFFWAKNGGFYFKEGDWEDYKSTVLRRKGPNGTTLSNATASTDLGGGSIVGRKQRFKRYKDDFESSIGTQSEMSEIVAGREEEYYEKKEVKEKKQKKEKKEKEKEKKKKWKSGTRASESVATDVQSTVTGLVEDDLGPDEVVRAYRHEKPAKVGGLNKAPDSTVFEGSTTHDAHSDLLSNREKTPTNTPKKIRHDNYTGGSGSPISIRKVESTSASAGGHGRSSFWNSSKKESQDEDRVKAEARKLQEKGRAAISTSGGGSSRRDFSYTPGDDAMSSISGSTAEEERRARRESRRARVPGSYAESNVGSEVSALSDGSGTKAYHHPIPGLSNDYAEERRRARESRGGYRRGD